MLAAVWTVCALYMAYCLPRGWEPLDAGVVGHMAERAMLGQVPHRDFYEGYTGGLSYLHALAFRLFGVNLFSVRIFLYLFFIGWVPSVYFIARRFLRPAAAAAVTLVAAAWGPPAYTEAMACWYNLFFGTWGTLALLRYGETERRRWLWIAGFCGGLSFLAKISGLYFLAAGLLFFVFREQRIAATPSDGKCGWSWFYRLFTAAGLLLFLAYLTSLISDVPAMTNYLGFVLPSACLVAWIFWEGRRRSSVAQMVRFRRLFSMILPFVAGAVIPVAAFLGWYVYKGALADWVRGVFVLAMSHVWWASGPALPLLFCYGLLPLVLALALAYDPTASTRRIARVIVPVGLGALLVVAWRHYPIYEGVGFSVFYLVPLAGLAALFSRNHGSGDGKRREQAFLVIAVGCLCSLVQFPAPVSIYFNYAAPLILLGLLAALGLLTGWRRGEPVTVGAVFAFYLIFAVWLRPPGYYFELKLKEDQSYKLRPLHLARAGGILVRTDQAEEYENLYAVVHAHARGSYIYATPDCPEVYFLTGYMNPTGSIQEFLDPGFPDPIFHTYTVLQAIDNRGVNLVVLGPQFYEPPLPAELQSTLEAEFPKTEQAGEYQVRWK